MDKVSARIASVALALAVAAAEPLAAQQSTPAASPPVDQQAPSGQNTAQPPIELPENPGRSASQPANAPQAGAPQENRTENQPSGTATAPPIGVSGGAASKPAGAAIAPPRQHQIRSFLIKLGFLAGAGAAIGTVVGLSAASPSRVPGSGH